MNELSYPLVPMKRALASCIVQNKCWTTWADQGFRNPPSLNTGPPLGASNITLCELGRRVANECPRVCSLLANSNCNDVCAILEEYVQADGYIFSSPSYDMFCTALIKTFLERKISFTYKSPEAFGKIPAARPGIASNFMKKASFIVTANCDDALEEVMGEPIYEAFESHLFFEEIDTVGKLYCGGVENMTDEEFDVRLQKAFDLGKNLVETIRQYRAENS